MLEYCSAHQRQREFDPLARGYIVCKASCEPANRGVRSREKVRVKRCKRQKINKHEELSTAREKKKNTMEGDESLLGVVLLVLCLSYICTCLTRFPSGFSDPSYKKIVFYCSAILPFLIYSIFLNLLSFYCCMLCSYCSSYCITLIFKKK